MISSAKWFLLVLATFRSARQTFSSTHTRSFLLALLLGALSLFAAAPAVAQPTTIWSATLTTENVGDAYGLGCANGFANTALACTSALADDDFTHDGTDYDITLLLLRNGNLTIQFSNMIPDSFNPFMLRVDTMDFAFTAASSVSQQRTWSNSGLSWTVNQQVSLSLVDPGYTLTVDARPVACGSTVTDMSMQPTHALVLTPAPAMGTTEETEVRVVPNRGTTWVGSLSIADSGRSSHVSAGITFAELRRNFPGFMGYEYRLKDTPSVTAQCFWTFGPKDDDRTSDPVPPPPPPGSPTVSGPPTGGGPSPGGGAPPPAVPSDPAPDSPRCGEDREDLESFYEALGGENWHENENWNSREPLGEWYGVETDDGSVVSLRLEDNNLSGKMPTRELLCLKDKELVELALWGNDDLEGEVPEELVLAVERAALRYIAETLDIYPEWFEDYKDPFEFEDWYEGVTTDDDGRVTELDLPGEVPETIISQLRKLRMITTSSEDGGCALSPKDDSSASSLFLLTLVVFAVLGRKRARD